MWVGRHAFVNRVGRRILSNIDEKARSLIQQPLINVTFAMSAGSSIPPFATLVKFLPMIHLQVVMDHLTIHHRAVNLFLIQMNRLIMLNSRWKTASLNAWVTIRLAPTLTSIQAYKIHVRSHSLDSGSDIRVWATAFQEAVSRVERMLRREEEVVVGISDFASPELQLWSFASQIVDLRTRCNATKSFVTQILKIFKVKLMMLSLFGVDV